MRCVINNDDLALTYGVTKGITKCYTDGITTSASIIVNSPAYKFTVKSIKNGALRDIGLGIHLNITDGPAFEKKLVNFHGNYRFNYISLLREIFINRRVLEYIRDDFEKQIQKVLNSELSPDHIDSDKHIHMIPPIFKITCELAAKYKISHIRLTREPFYISGTEFCYPFMPINITKNILLNSFSKFNIATAQKFRLKYTDASYGILYTDHMDFDCIKAAITDAKAHKFKLIEILLHPGYIKDIRDSKFISPLMEKYSQETNREMEAAALLNPQLKNFIKENNISLVKFSEV